MAAYKSSDVTVPARPSCCASDHWHVSSASPRAVASFDWGSRMRAAIRAVTSVDQRPRRLVEIRGCAYSGGNFGLDHGGAPARRVSDTGGNGRLLRP